MSRQKDAQELIDHKNQAFSKIDAYLNSLIASGDFKKMGKADKLCYWLEDWTNFLDFETRFSPMSLRRYKRGEIIKVHLGFNVGSEEGGLHYAVVLDKNNAKSSPVVTIVPLTSVKPHTNLEHLKKGSIFLGNELFTSLNAKISSTFKHCNDERKLLDSLINSFTPFVSSEEQEEVRRRIAACYEEIYFLNKMRLEVSKMRIGSIALVNQITTISKIRIYDPKTDHDVLSGIRLSNEKLDLIDQAVIENLINS